MALTDQNNTRQETAAGYVAAFLAAVAAMTVGFIPYFDQVTDYLQSLHLPGRLRAIGSPCILRVLAGLITFGPVGLVSQVFGVRLYQEKRRPDGSDLFGAPPGFMTRRQA